MRKSPEQIEEERQEKLNKRAPKFKIEGPFSLIQNKWFHLFWMVIVCLGFIAYYFFDTTDDSWKVFPFLFIVYFGFWIFGVVEFLRNRKIKKIGTKYDGKIVKMLKREYWSRNDMHYHRVYYLLVEYYDTRTGETKQYETSSININPCLALTSLDVSVYEDNDGRILVSDFKQAKYNKDTLKERGIKIEIEHM
jgi:hypothetical protein